MKEFVTDAIVLHTRPRGERDKVIDLFTKELGRIEARAVHAQRSTSKFSPHCDVLHIIRARLVYTGGFTLTDAVTLYSFSLASYSQHFSASVLGLCVVLRTLLPRAHQDSRLWSLCEGVCRGNTFLFSSFLTLLGYNPLCARCATCGCVPVVAFMFRDHSFFCTACVVQLPENEVLLLYE